MASEDFIGLTKREYFAALALQGFVLNQAYLKAPRENARAAVEQADALIEELNKENDNAK
jgi:hypothetical protein